MPGEQYAFIIDSIFVDYISKNEPCNTRSLGDVFLKGGYGIGFAKSFPDVDKFDLAILRLRESGFIDGLERKWLRGPCPNSNAGMYMMYNIHETNQILLQRGEPDKGNLDIPQGNTI